MNARREHRPSLINRRTAWALAFLVAFVWSLDQAGIFDRTVVNRGGWTLAWQFAQAALRPDLGADTAALALSSSFTTLAFAIAGTALSVALGVVFGILCSETFWQLILPERGCGARAPWLLLRAVLAIPRAIHEAIWGLFFINILGLDPLVAILAIAVPYGATTAKVFAEILDETPKGALLVLQAGGVTPGKAILYGLLPQAFPDLLSYTFYRLECAIRAATILGLIGAGGLGFQILLSLQSLRYEEVWTFLYALMLLSGLTDAWSSSLRRRLHLSSRTELKLDRASWDRRSGARIDPFAKRSLQAALLLVPLSFWYVGTDLAKPFAPRTMDLLAGVMRDAFPPRMDGDLLERLLHLSAQTVSMSILAIALAATLGLLLSFPAAASFALPGGIFDHGGRSRGRILIGAAIVVTSRGALLFLRAMSEAIWALVALFFIFPGILPGALGLGLYNLGVLGRLMAEVTENVDQRPLRALQAQGASAAQVFVYGVLPLTLPRCIALALYRWEVCIRATVVVRLVGAGGIGRLLGEQLSSFDYPSVTTSLIFLVGLTFGVDMLSAAVRRAVRGAGHG